MRSCCVLLSVAVLCFAAHHTSAQHTNDTNQTPQQTPPQQPNLPREIAVADEAFDRQDWSASVELYRAAIAAGFEHPLVHMRLGYALHVLGRLDEALPHHVRAASAIIPEIRIDGLYNAACASALTGNTEQALEYLAKAIDAGFKDTPQVARDSDLNSLREDERFKKLVAGIGRTPRLHEQMDFFLGTWTQTDESGQVVDMLTCSRPLAGSHAILTTSTNFGGGQLAGVLTPDFDTRQWKWTAADGHGTLRQLVGERQDDGSIVFTGTDSSPVGLPHNAILRLTYTPTNDGRVKEKAESSTDGGATWHTHHELFFVRQAPRPAASNNELPEELARVLRDYEAAWRAKDAAGLAALFAPDGFVLPSGRPPVRGRDNIQKHYAGAGGALHLRSLVWAQEGPVAYIIG
jgi:hypothetical protein